MIDNRREVELAEGVKVFIRPAGVIPRLLARSLDLIIQGIASALIAGLAIAIGYATSIPEIGYGLITISSFFIFWFYDVFFELTAAAATPGKRIMKLKVVQLSGAPPHFFSSFTRALLLPIDYLPAGLIGLTSVMASRYSQRLGDLCAGTLVVYRDLKSTDAMPSLQIDSVQPPLKVERAEQRAFLTFAQNYQRLSDERKTEMTRSLLQSEQGTKNGVSYALGLAKWLSRTE